MKKETTIYDLAEHLSLSPSTVSRALNDHPAINQKTKERVNKAAEKFGYQLNTFAKNLRKKSTDTLGVITPKLDSTFMASVLAGMEKVANQSGYNLLITQSQESQEKEIANAKTMFSSRVDGLMVSASAETETLEHFDQFVNKGVPVLFFDRVLEDSKMVKIVIDNRKAGRQATEHLIEQGCKRIWHITGDLRRNVYSDRYKGYRDALKKAGLPLDESSLFESKLIPDDVDEIVEVIKKSKQKPDGIFVSNDLYAGSLLIALKYSGLRIPEDIAIVGFNNDPISRIIEPKLTTVHYPAYEMGELTAKTLIDHIKGEVDMNMQDTLILSHKLIVRGSSDRSGQK
ncbi:LacI family DNA-binding transcriptional regulator [Jiulongibacter sediminis]|uniref:LacI family transcriptional regulator n=1 Tax=Jiulongibacter sediminis TaxID=1605367 RepID=A0A0P7C5M6_9BACT|nr:LacI family DNA-binding transcriptional regulator [Jiulongibacter sediminis]KPM48619.1 LacI family transcriptional regulator [Jiulongibacter sediminis]TBX25157.1 LacI family transcriptional regulator [Jiulongibacter sediminis]